MLQPGDHVPDVILHEGTTSVALSSLLGTPLVLYFYPKDDTPGCTAEACSFRDAYEDFVEVGARVIGVSSDDAQSHEAFASTHRLPFRLLSDSDGAARSAFGIPKTLGLFPGRATFVIASDGTIVNAFNSQFLPEKHVRTALAALRTLVGPGVEDHLHEKLR